MERMVVQNDQKEQYYDYKVIIFKFSITGLTVKLLMLWRMKVINFPSGDSQTKNNVKKMLLLSAGILDIMISSPLVSVLMIS